MNIFALLEIAVELGASDVHLTVNCPPRARIKGRFENLREEILTPEDTENMSREITTANNFKRLQENGEVDFSLSLDNGDRFRVNNS